MRSRCHEPPDRRPEFGFWGPADIDGSGPRPPGLGIMQPAGLRRNREAAVPRLAILFSLSPVPTCFHDGCPPAAERPRGQRCAPHRIDNGLGRFAGSLSALQATWPIPGPAPGQVPAGSRGPPAGRTWDHPNGDAGSRGCSAARPPRPGASGPGDVAAGQSRARTDRASKLPSRQKPLSGARAPGRAAARDKLRLERRCGRAVRPHDRRDRHSDSRDGSRS